MADLPSPGIGFTADGVADAAPTKWMQAHPAVQAEFPSPVIHYPFGAVPEHGLELDFVIGEDGALVCMSPVSAYRDGEAPVLTEERKAFLAVVPSWRFKPFLVDGKPVRVTERLLIDEDELPQAHVDTPKGEPAEITITQDNHPWLASFGPYHVELHGDGTAIYTSLESDDPLGPQTYHVDAKAVQAIATKAEAADFWSLRDLYRQPGAYGGSFERLNITLGGVTKSLTDDGPSTAGLPAKAGQLQFDVLAAARIDFWQTPTPATLAQLKANGFDFSAKAAGVLLLQMVQNPSVKDDAIAALIGLGAPQNAGGDSHYMDEHQDLLEAALANGRSDLAAQLIAGGALLSDGKPDQDKIGWAFSDAVYSGNLASVDLIVPFRPAMTYADPDTGDKVSILLRLGDNRSYVHHAPLDVAQRLIDLGTNVDDVDPEGRTLLYKVVNNPDFAAFLLDHGAKIDMADKTGRTALGIVFAEDAALLLLSRGADPRLGKSGDNLRFNIKNNHWLRVKTWLSEHGYADVLIARPDDDS